MQARTRTLTALVAALTAAVALMLPVPATAQEAPVDGVTDPRFRTEETRRLFSEIQAAEARYAANERRIEALEQDYDFGSERDRLMVENAAMDVDNPVLREEFVDARLDAIEEADAPSADKVDALESLESYAENELEFGSSAGDDVSAALSDAEDAAEAEEAAQQEQEQQDQGDGGAATPSGSESAGNSGGDGGGDISLLSGAFLVALLGGALVMFLRSRSGNSGGLKEAVTRAFGPSMAEPPKTATATQRPAKHSESRERQTVPEGDSGRENGSGDRDLNGDTDDVVRDSEGADSVAELQDLYDAGTALDHEFPEPPYEPENGPDGEPDDGSGGRDDTPPRRRRRGPGDYPDEGPGGAPGNPFGR